MVEQADSGQVPPAVRTPANVAERRERVHDALRGGPVQIGARRDLCQAQGGVGLVESAEDLHCAPGRANEEPIAFGRLKIGHARWLDPQGAGHG